MQSFFITGMPRSRTKWFSEYFTMTGAPCIHDAIGYCSRADVYALVEAGVGISDSGMWITDLLEVFPDVPVVVIDRDCAEVEVALGAIGLPYHPLLKQGSADVKNSLRVPFRDINNRIEEIHTFCTKRPFRKELADMMIKTVVKQDAFSVPTGQLEEWS